MRLRSHRILLFLAAAAVLGAAVAGAATSRLPIYYKGELPGPVATDIGSAMQPIEKAPKHDVIATESLKMYSSGWARVLDKAREKVEAAGGNALVITSWGFDPSSKTDVKKMERVKRIEFEIAKVTTS